MKINRRERRQIRAMAEELGKRAAATCFGHRRDGTREKIQDRRAVLALERAFTMLARRDGTPYVTRLTDEAAKAFPGVEAAGAEKVGARPWLAVGFDQAGAACFSVQYIVVPGCGPAEEQEIAEAAMLMALAPHLHVSGFAVPAKGRV